MIKEVGSGQTTVPISNSSQTPARLELDDFHGIEVKTPEDGSASEEEEKKDGQHVPLTKEELELRYRVYEGLLEWPTKTDHLYYA